MKLSILLLAVLFAAVATTLAAEKSADAKNIQGTWLPVKGELAGQPMADEVLKTITLQLNGGKYEVTAENVDKGTYTLDSAAKPKIIDITGAEGPNAGKKIPAIYELNGDTLRICYGLGG